MGRNALPVSVIRAQGKSKHVSKAEEQRRKEAEVKLGTKDLKKLTPPAFVKNDLTASRYWDKHLKEYQEAAKQGIEILTTADVGALAMYCKTYSEYEEALKRKQIYELNNPYEIDTILKLEQSINKKMDMLLKMQDRLFLNPLAKVKNVPKPEKEKTKNPMEEEFDL